MKAVFRTITAAAIICATASPALSQTGPEVFQIYTNGPVNAYTIRDIAGTELDLLAARFNPQKYDLLIESNYISVPDEKSFFLVKVGAMPRGTLERPAFYVQHRVNSPMHSSDARKAIRAGIQGLAEERQSGQKL